MFARPLSWCHCGCLIARVSQKCLIFNESARPFFALPKLPGMSPAKAGSRRKEYAERRVLGYTAEQMFDVVNDVGQYKSFVPWCTDSRVVKKNGSSQQCELEIGFPPIVERYTSNVTWQRPTQVRSVCKETKLFNVLLSDWKFGAGIPGNPQSCTLDYYVTFEFRSALHAHLAHLFFDEIVKTMVGAFLKQAQTKYGEPSIPVKDMKPKIIKFKS